MVDSYTPKTQSPQGFPNILTRKNLSKTRKIQGSNEAEKHPKSALFLRVGKKTRKKKTLALTGFRGTPQIKGKKNAPNIDLCKPNALSDRKIRKGVLRWFTQKST